MKLKLKSPQPYEKDIQASILEYLHAKKIFCWKEHSGGLPMENGKYFIPIGLKGKADILGCYKGRLLAVEVKRPGGVLSEDQSYFIKRINDEGGIAFVAYSIDDCIKHGI